MSQPSLDLLGFINLYVHFIPQKQKETENLFKEIITENFPDLGNEVNIQIDEAQKILSLSLIFDIL